MSDNLELNCLHVPGRCYCLFDKSGKFVYSCGSDSILKKTEVRSKEMVSSIDFPDELLAMSINRADEYLSEDVIAIGGAENQVEVIKVTDNSSAENLEKVIVLRFGSRVSTIDYSQDGNFIAAGSEEGLVSVYDQRSQLTFKSNPSHQGPVLHVSIDPKGEFVVSTGCDGMLQIYAFENTEAEGPKLSVIKQIKITNNQIPDGSMRLQTAWHPSGERLAVSGDIMLGIINRNDWMLNCEKEISHEKAISLCEWSKNGVYIMTVCEKNVVKVWDFPSKAMVSNISNSDTIWSLSWGPTGNKVAFIDNEGNLGIWEHVIPHEFVNPSKVTDSTAPNQSVLANSINNEMEQSEVMASMEMGMDAEGQNVNQEDMSQQVVIENADGEEGEQEQIVFNAAGDDEEQVEQTGTEKYIRLDEDQEKQIQQALNFYHHNINAEPQEKFMPGATEEVSTRKLLHWGIVGKMVWRNEGQFEAIDIEFNDTSFNHKMVVQDDCHYLMGTMNYYGAVLASHGKQVDLDEYEDETKEKELSTVKFIKFHAWNMHFANWVVKLPEGENAENVAVGNDWVAVYTSQHYLRVFTHAGRQRMILSLAEPMVTMVGYENQLAMVSHGSVPMFGCQRLMLKIIDMSSFKTIHQGGVPVSPDTTLDWIGYSEEGQLFTYDSSHILRGQLQQMGDNWVPYLDVFETQLKTTTKNFWPIGVSEGQLMGIELRDGEKEPDLMKTLLNVALNFATPLCVDAANDIAEDETIIRQELEINHCQGYVNNNFANHRLDCTYKHAIDITPDLVIQKCQQFDKSLLNAIRQECLGQNPQKAYEYVKQMKTDQFIKIAVELCEKLGEVTLAKRVRNYLEARQELKSTPLGAQPIIYASNQNRVSSQAPVAEETGKKKFGLGRSTQRASTSVSTVKEVTPTSTVESVQESTLVQHSVTEAQEEKLTLDQHAQSSRVSTFMNPFGKKSTTGNSSTSAVEKNIFNDLTQNSSNLTGVKRRKMNA